mmetsp:Transcript_86996/g.246669  ORF Transcript_86996/g.246669 Transcript_86996/m.246669 type:complete len:205 (-) Transcript_86996:321-935(-)
MPSSAGRQGRVRWRGRPVRVQQGFSCWGCRRRRRVGRALWREPAGLRAGAHGGRRARGRGPGRRPGPRAGSAGAPRGPRRGEGLWRCYCLGRLTRPCKRRAGCRLPWRLWPAAPSSGRTRGRHASHRPHRGAAACTGPALPALSYAWAGRLPGVAEGGQGGAGGGRAQVPAEGGQARRRAALHLRGAGGGSAHRRLRWPLRQPL